MTHVKSLLGGHAKIAARAILLKEIRISTKQDWMRRPLAACAFALAAFAVHAGAPVMTTEGAVQVAVREQTGNPHQVAFSFPGEAWDGIWASDEEQQQARE